MLNLLQKILLFGLQKVGKANKNGLGLVDKLKIISKLFLHPKWFYSKKPSNSKMP